MTSALIVRLGSLGDIVHAMPAASALRNQFPQARIDWLVEPQYTELLGLLESLDHVIPVDPRGRTGAGRLETVRALRAAKYDVALDFQGLVKSAVLVRAAGARRTIGFPRAHLREPAARFLYTEMPDPGAAEHVVHKNLALLAALGIHDSVVRFPLRIPRSPSVRAIVDQYGSGQYALVNPGAAWPNKRWPTDRFGALAAAIRSEFGLRSLVLWGPGEEPLAAQVVAGSSGAADLLPPTTIADIAGIARDARLMVSGDTGPLHLAGAVGAPLVALFGPTRPERNGPWAADDLTVSRVERCSCLYQRRCRLETPCINDISVDEAVRAVRRRLTAGA